MKVVRSILLVSLLAALLTLATRVGAAPEAEPYTIAQPGLLIVIWPDPAVGYPWAYTAYLDLVDENGLPFQVTLPYQRLEVVGGKFITYYSARFCRDNGEYRITGGTMIGVSNPVEISLLSTRYFAFCDHIHLPLIERSQ